MGWEEEGGGGGAEEGEAGEEQEEEGRGGGGASYSPSSARAADAAASSSSSDACVGRWAWWWCCCCCCWCCCHGTASWVSDRACPRVWMWVLEANAVEARSRLLLLCFCAGSSRRLQFLQLPRHGNKDTQRGAGRRTCTCVVGVSVREGSVGIGDGTLLG